MKVDDTLPGGPLPPAPPCTPDPTFEDKAYQTAPRETRQWLREHRPLIRALFATPEAQEIIAKTVVCLPDGTRTKIDNPFAAK